MAGFLHRSGVTISKIVVFEPKKRSNTIKPKAKPKPKPVQAKVIQMPTVEPKGKIVFLELQPKHCRWIEEVDGSDPFKTMFCGNYADNGSWCEYHKRLVYKGEYRVPQDENGNLVI